MKHKFEGPNPDLYAQWLKFEELVPVSDNVQEYVNKHGLKVPLGNYLFPDSSLNTTASIAALPTQSLQRRVPTEVRST